MKPTDKTAAELMEILVGIHIASLRCDVLISQLKGNGKNWVRVVIKQKLEKILNDMKYILPDADLQILKKDSLNDEAALQMDELRLQIMRLNKEQRDLVESYISTLNLQK